MLFKSEFSTVPVDHLKKKNPANYACSIILKWKFDIFFLFAVS